MKSLFYNNILTSAKKLLIIVIIFHGINNLFWFKNDGYLHAGSHTVWLEQKSIIYSQILLDNRTSILKKVEDTLDFFKLKHFYYEFSATNFNLASFFIALPMATYLDGYAKLFLINLILFLQFLLVILAIYYLGKIIFNETIGAWSSIIFSFYPGAIGLSRKVNSELMITFFIVLAIIVFFQQRHFSRTLKLFLLFIIFIFGTLSGGLFLVYFIPLFLLDICYSLLFHKRKIETLFYLVIFLCLILLFFNFYFNGEYSKVYSSLKKGFDECYKKLFSQSSDFIGSAANGVLEIFFFAPQTSFCPCTQTTNVGINVKALSFYIAEMMYYTSPLFFLLAIWSLSFLLKDKGIDFYKKILFAIWIFFSYLLLSLFHIKWGKFITPVFPVLALSSGVFICHYFGKQKIKKIIVFSLGILTVFYYSYFSPSRKYFLESISDTIIAHSPTKSRFIDIAEQIAAKINSYGITKENNAINIIFLDKESVRFGNAWCIDQSMRVENLTKLFLKKKFQEKSFWSLSDDFYNRLDKQDFLILITLHKIDDIEKYLYDEETKNASNLKFEIIYEDSLKRDVLIYLLKISKNI